MGVYTYVREVGDPNWHRFTFAAAATLIRNPLQQPFLTASIWNTPIGSGATYAAAGLAPALGNSHDWVTVDPIFIGMDPTDPLKALTNISHVGGSPGTVVIPYHIPAGTTVYVPASMAHNGTWNGIAALLDADGRHFWSGQTLYLTAGGDPQWARTRPQGPDDLYGLGREGPHGGSRLGGLGGVVRGWEFFGSAPIRHALALNVYGVRFLSTTTSGFRWPAYTADGQYNVSSSVNYYGRTGTGFDGMKMGSLLALPQGYDVGAITDPNVLRLANCLRDFGAYIVDNTARDVHAFSVESTAQAAWQGAGATFHAELMAVISDLQLISNNDATHIGGGGTPLVTPVPDIAP